MKQRERQIPPQSRHLLRDALERLVRLYQDTDNKAETARWRKELAETKSTAEK
jgi:hypothetical protein